jgi:2-keto-3-deoxy-L-rhamnonate aldolase RhmA
MTTDFLLTLISRDPELIRVADSAGIDRVGIDIERLGKRERQADVPNARISDHELNDLAIVTAAVRRAEVFIRLNPLHPGSRAEIERALALGAKVAMLPYFTTAYEVEAFVDLVRGRAVVTLLLETGAAAARLHEIVAVRGVSEIMVGLNDLHRTLGLKSHFEVLASDLLMAISSQIRDAGLRFGLGGVARPGDNSLPVAADLVLAQFPRLGATSAWIARSFFRDIELAQFAAETIRLRCAIDHWFAQPPEVLAEEHAELRRAAAAMRERTVHERVA